MMEPILIGEVAIEPDPRRPRKVGAGQLLAGARTVTHTIERALDRSPGGTSWARPTGQPVGRLLGDSIATALKPYASLLFDEPGKLRAALETAMARGYKAFKLGGILGRTGNPADDELLIKTARDTVGDGEIMVDGGGLAAVADDALNTAETPAA